MIWSKPWDIVDDRSDVNNPQLFPARQLAKQYLVNNTSSYKFYRFDVISRFDPGKGCFQLSDMNLYGPTEVSVQDIKVAPKVFTLSQNYPNPFNPSTNFKFTVAKTGRAVLKVYNILGAEVSTLFEGNAEAGKYYTVTFNASKLASGVYFTRLESDSKAVTKKIVLLK